LTAVLYFLPGYFDDANDTCELWKLDGGVASLVHDFNSGGEEYFWATALHYHAGTNRLYIFGLSQWDDYSHIYSYDGVSVQHVTSYSYSDWDMFDCVTHVVEKDGIIYLAHGGYNGIETSAVFNPATGSVSVADDYVGQDLLNNTICYYPATGKWYWVDGGRGIYESTDCLNWTNKQTVKTGLETRATSDRFLCGLGVNPIDNKLYFASFNDDHPYIPASSNCYYSIWRMESNGSIVRDYTRTLPMSQYNHGAMFLSSVSIPGDTPTFAFITWSYNSGYPIWLYKYVSPGVWEEETIPNDALIHLGQGSVACADGELYMVVGGWNGGMSLIKRDSSGMWSTVKEFAGYDILSTYQGTTGIAVAASTPSTVSKTFCQFIRI
jgi:hypothetical protein